MYIQFLLPFKVQQEGKIQTITSYRKTLGRTLAYYTICLTSFGLFYLICRWYLRIWITSRLQQCCVVQADYFLVVGLDKSLTLSPALLQSVTSRQLQKQFQVSISLINNQYRFQKYIFDDVHQTFVPVEFNLSKQQNRQIIERYHKGILTQQQLIEQTNYFGLNSSAIPNKNVYQVLLEEVLSPFYVFQLISVCVMYSYNYPVYPSVIIVLTSLSIGQSLSHQMTNFHKLQAISSNEGKVKVYRFCDGLISLENDRIKINEQFLDQKPFTSLNSDQLIPGDIIQIEVNQIIPCDLILLTGEAMMNEAMLTGESQPVLKNSLPYNTNLYNSTEEGKQSTLLAGTICIQIKTSGNGIKMQDTSSSDFHNQIQGQIETYQRLHISRKALVLALVTQTSFNTSKGHLIRSILFTGSTYLKFHQDQWKFVVVLQILAVMGCFITLKSQLFSAQYLGSSQLVLGNSLALFTLAFPSSLPTSLLVSISIALYRLKTQLIYCMNSSKIITSGNVTLMCFDKTGTLTEDSQDIYSILTVGQIKMKDILGFKISNIEDNVAKNIFQSGQVNDEIIVYEYVDGTNQGQIHSASTLMDQTMGSCHGLTIINGQLVGDPLDIKAYQYTQWKIQEEEELGYQQILISPKQLNIKNSEREIRFGLKILRRFDFQSKLQRMSVIVQTPDGMRIFCKGSPEIIKNLCLPQTVPRKYRQVLEYYAQNGYRVIACAVRIYKQSIQDIQTISRTEIEVQLTFLGFIILQNKLKPITVSVIQELQNASIRSVMVTGDNILTAISIAQQCMIVSENKKVYFGELQQDERNQGKLIVWRDFTAINSGIKTHDLNQISQIKIDDRKYRNHDKFKKLKMDQETNKMDTYQLDRSNKLINESRKYSKKYLISSAKIATSPIRNEQIYFNEHDMPWPTETNEYVLALTGAAFMYLIEEDTLNPNQILKTVLERTQVYARMSPEEKGQLVTLLQTKLDQQPLVGFCGDGANDCVALKRADIGISFNQAEASIAAPFTSQICDISCVPILLREGRAALSTTFICFKFMIMYSIIELTTQCLLYLSYTTFTNAQFVYDDLFTVLPLALTIGLRQSKSTLTQQVPQGTLICSQVIISIVGQSLIQVGFQIVIYIVLLDQNWFVSAINLYPVDQDELYVALQTSYESTSMFLFSNLQYPHIAVAFSISNAFLKPIYTNKYFISLFIMIIIFDHSLIIFPQQDDSIYHGYFGLLFKSETTSMSHQWIMFLSVMTVLNGLFTVVFERLVVDKISTLFSKKNQINK